MNMFTRMDSCLPWNSQVISDQLLIEDIINSTTTEGDLLAVTKIKKEANSLANSNN